ncbi:hypothetical protein GYA49_05495 [Candidatus Beckwithbacteria bacterium]|nr:hypothetical protein [Candidatus Beckwithbacteria bacterium]
MKFVWQKITILFLLLISVQLLIVSPIFAEDRLISDFEYQYEKYRQLYPEYETARDEFLQTNSLASQNIAIEKTRTLLAQRAQVMRTYLLALKFKLQSNLGISKDDKEKLSASIDDEVGWLQNHMDDINNASNPTLGDLFEISKRFEKKETDFRVLGYETMSRVIIGKVYTLNQEYIAISSQLKPYVEETGVGYLSNWLNEAQNSAFEALQSLKSAETMVDELVRKSSSSEQVIKAFTQIKTDSESAKLALTKGIGFQNEIIDDLNKRLPALNSVNRENIEKEATASSSNN